MSLVVLTREQFYSEAKSLFGSNPKNWTFECPWCKFHQSMNIVLEIIEMNGYLESMRYGKITKENISKLQPKIDQECLGKECNYVSYGLISGSLEVDGHRYLSLVNMNPNLGKQSNESSTQQESQD